jgi:hypothetical protein
MGLKPTEAHFFTTLSQLDTETFQTKAYILVVESFSRKILIVIVARSDILPCKGR